MTTDSPNEFAIDVLADKMRNCNVRSQIPWERISEVQQEEWRITARDALKSMGDASTRKDEAVGVSEAAMSEINGASPANDELIAKLEAKAFKNTCDIGSDDLHPIIYLEDAIEIIRAHKPAPVDLNKLANTIAAMLDNWRNIAGQEPSPREIAKTAIQALGREVL